MARQEVVVEITKGETRVDDVLDDDHVAAGNVGVEVLHDAHDAAGGGGLPVGGDRHEVHLEGAVNGAGQVAHENDGTLEDTNQQRGAAGIVRGDLRAHLRDALGDGGLADDDVAENGSGPGRDS